jgi:NAD-dependent deacetylase
VVVFTGAGISTESGIPDFRSPGGVWSRMSPIYFQDFVTNEAKRREAWTRAFSGVAGWVGKSPNAGHRAVTELAGLGKVVAVITQNVDNLHQASGLPPEKVIELHGNAGYATCLECGLRHELDNLKAAFLATDALPACRACGGIVKTATISFGQSLPEAALARAEADHRQEERRGPGHRQPRAHRPGRHRRPRPSRRDRPGDERGCVPALEP